MTLSECQKDVHDWTSQFDPQYWPPFEMVAAMTEEVGEVARAVSHIHWIKKKKSWENNRELSEELVDLLFTTICLANTHDIDLQKERNHMIDEKLNKRDKNRFKKKE